MLILRSEYRLVLCFDNVDMCFILFGCEVGLILDARWVKFEKKRDAVDNEMARL